MSKDYKLVWRKKARLALFVAFGGKCAICEYERSVSAIDYHHLDPKEKDDLLSKAMANGHAWSKIVEEARKCTILCCRCHRELHAGIVELPLNPPKFNEEYADIIKVKQIKYDSCPICGKDKINYYKHCSVECSTQSQRKFEITKEELEKLVREKPFTQIGKMFGVSDNAIRKRCKLLGIVIPKFEVGHWIKKA
jgi:hypothetical protein